MFSYLLEFFFLYLLDGVYVLGIIVQIKISIIIVEYAIVFFNFGALLNYFWVYYKILEEG